MIQFKVSKVFPYSVGILSIFFGLLIVGGLLVYPSILIEIYHVDYIWLYPIFFLPILWVISSWIRIGFFQLRHPIAIDIQNDIFTYYNHKGEIQIPFHDIESISTSAVHGGINTNIGPILTLNQCINFFLKDGLSGKYEKYGKIRFGTTEYGAPVCVKNNEGKDVYYIQIPLWGLSVTSESAYSIIFQTLNMPENKMISGVSMFLTSGSF